MTVTRYGGHGRARCSAGEVSDDFVYSASVASPYLPLSLSLSHAVCCSHMSDAWAEG